jgi:hypothetical protein
VSAAILSLEALIGLATRAHETPARRKSPSGLVHEVDRSF